MKRAELTKGLCQINATTLAIINIIIKNQPSSKPNFPPSNAFRCNCWRNSRDLVRGISVNYGKCSPSLAGTQSQELRVTTTWSVKLRRTSSSSANALSIKKDRNNCLHQTLQST
jgi:hypothetical protein